MLVSICMTTYNGERFLKRQLTSILSQMGELDELIVCDDLSSDNTVTVVRSFSDSRIKLFINSERLGHVKNFEKCISLSSNDIILLSDQDDIWSNDKISVVKSVFKNSDIILYHHGITTIDESELVIKLGFNYVLSEYNNLHKLLKLTKIIFRQHFFGCCISFRKELKAKLLPFPNITYAHDHWISSIGLVAGEVICDNNPLIYYRQHSSNLTPKNKLSVIKMLKIRVLQGVLIGIAFIRCKNV